jgi:hypothetical protein
MLQSSVLTSVKSRPFLVKRLCNEKQGFASAKVSKPTLAFETISSVLHLNRKARPLE